MLFAHTHNIPNCLPLTSNHDRRQTLAESSKQKEKRPKPFSQKRHPETENLQLHFRLHPAETETKNVFLGAIPQCEQKRTLQAIIMQESVSFSLRKMIAKFVGVTQAKVFP
jgi:hypothetical protein